METGKGVSSTKQSRKRSSVEKNVLLEVGLILSPNVFTVAII